VDILIDLLKIVTVFSLLMLCVSIMTWVERRLSAIIQYRLGPNRVGPMGLLQPIADGIKFIQKEDIIPADAHKLFYVLAPALAVIPALCAFAVIPFGPTVTILGKQVALVIPRSRRRLAANVGRPGASTRSSQYGWSSNSKFSLIGGLRSSAQMISYELPMALSVASVVLVAGTLRPTQIVAQQRGSFLHWNTSPAGGRFSDSCSSWPGLPRPRARRSTSPRPTPSSSRATTPSTRGCGARPSSWPSTST
jgi:NADH-quinone oxidoreductase subunit H